MSARSDGFGWFSRRTHPRLALLLGLGTVVGLLGAILAVTAGPLGHGLGSAGLRAAVLGSIVFAFAASGLLAFAVFERAFD